MKLAESSDIPVFTKRHLQIIFQTGIIKPIDCALLAIQHDALIFPDAMADDIIKYIPARWHYRPSITARKLVPISIDLLDDALKLMSKIGLCDYEKTLFIDRLGTPNTDVDNKEEDEEDDEEDDEEEDEEDEDEEEAKAA